jgi:antitoxin PrlF
MSKAYNLRTTKIGNSSGFRLPADFYRDHPQFADANGWIEVISDTTAVISIEPPDDREEDDDDSLMMRLFLDFALNAALKNQDLERYTLEMSAIARDLLDDGRSGRVSRKVR